MLVLGDPMDGDKAGASLGEDARELRSVAQEVELGAPMGQWFQITTRFGVGDGQPSMIFLVLVVQGLVASSSSVALVGIGTNWREWKRSTMGQSCRVERLMVCECGEDLGRVTLRTKGLCDACGASKWLQCARSILPKSTAIAAGLTRRKAGSCVHQETQCISRCGVVRQDDGIWQPMTRSRREEWFQKLLQAQQRLNAAKDSNELKYAARDIALLLGSL